MTLGATARAGPRAVPSSGAARRRRGEALVARARARGGRRRRGRHRGRGPAGRRRSGAAGPPVHDDDVHAPPRPRPRSRRPRRPSPRDPRRGSGPAGDVRVRRRRALRGCPAREAPGRSQHCAGADRARPLGCRRRGGQPRDRDHRTGDAPGQGVHLPHATDRARCARGRRRRRGVDGQQPRPGLRPRGAPRLAGGQGGHARARGHRHRRQRRRGVRALSGGGQGPAHRGVRSHRRPRRQRPRRLDRDRHAAGPRVGEAPWVEQLVAAVFTARADSDTLVVFLHWGIEGQMCPDDGPAASSPSSSSTPAPTSSSAATPTVSRERGRLGTGFVGYGLGNFVFYNEAGPAGVSGVLQVTATGRDIDSYSWVPARIKGGVPEPLPPGADADQAVAEWNALRDCTGLTAYALRGAMHGLAARIRGAAASRRAAGRYPARRARRPGRMHYDEFGLFHENAEEAGLPWDGPPVVRARRGRGRAPAGRSSALVWGERPPRSCCSTAARRTRTRGTRSRSRSTGRWSRSTSLVTGTPTTARTAPFDPAANAADVAVAIRRLGPGRRDGRGDVARRADRRSRWRPGRPTSSASSPSST